MRGESGRVAERVRSLLSEHGRPAERPSAHYSDGPPGGEEPAWSGSTGGAVPASLAPAGGREPSRWDRLAARVPVRLDPGRKAALGMGVAVLVAAVITGAWLLSARPRALAVASRPTPIAGASSPLGSAAPVRSGATGPPASGAPAGSVGSATASSSDAGVVVDVAGKVRHPGLYRLPAGSRVDDALRAAGGAVSGVSLDSLNLAARVVDGQQIAVGVSPVVGGPGAPGGGDAGGAGGAAGAPAGPVNLNTADLTQLETLPGVGPVLGQRILDWRTAHGGFARVDQLDDVPGVGQVKFAALKPLVTV